MIREVREPIQVPADNEWPHQGSVPGLLIPSPIIFFVFITYFSFGIPVESTTRWVQRRSSRRK